MNQAQRYLSEAVVKDPANAETRYLWAQTLFDCGRFDDAMKQFAEAERLDPKVKEKFVAPNGQRYLEK